MRISIIGVGNQGRHHLRFLQHLEGIKLTLLIDRDEDRARQAAEEYHVPFAIHYASFLSEFDAAIIAVPTVDHFQIASDLIRAGKHVLIEKPVADSVESAQRLAELADRNGVVAQVGFPERFNPALTRALPSISHPRFIETDRLGVFSPRSLDIDVVLDLMIHDLDLLYLVLGEEPSHVEAVGIPILSNQVDIANARLKFPSKCVVNLTASRVSAKRMRKMRLFQPYSYLSLDFVQQSYSMFSLQPNACAGSLPQIHRSEYHPDALQHPLQLEQIAFRDSVLKGKFQGVSIAEAIPSLKVALAIKKSFDESEPPAKS
jgi:predicted dehydrogenase